MPLAAGFVSKGRPRLIADGLDVQPELVLEPLGRAVLDRNRPIQPVPLAGEARLDRFGDGDGAVRANLDIGGELLDDERPLGRRGPGQGDEACDGNGARQKAGGAHGRQPNLTCGTARSASSPTWKNSRPVKLKSDAKMFQGTCAIFVL